MGRRLALGLVREMVGPMELNLALRMVRWMAGPMELNLAEKTVALTGPRLVQRMVPSTQMVGLMGLHLAEKMAESMELN